MKPPEIRYPAALPLLRRDERLPEGYQQMVRKLMLGVPPIRWATGCSPWPKRPSTTARSTSRRRVFGLRAALPRNLKLNLALERALLIRDGRDFDDEPIRVYARAERMRAAGRADSAEAALTAGLARYPGARLRHHFRLALAEIARDRGDHAAAVEQALAVADTSTGSRLAPAALKLAGDETLALGGTPEKASGYYQALLERFPDSPLAPAVRAQVLLLRKRMQL